MSKAKVKANGGEDNLSVQEPKQTKGQRRREEVLSLARTRLIDHGYDHFALRAVADQAGMKLGNLQYYFPTKEDLLEELGEREFGHAIEIVTLGQEETGPAGERLARVVGQLLSEWQTTGGRVYAVISLLALHQDRFRRQHVRQYRRFYGAMAGFVAELNPGAAEDACMRTARLMTSVLDGALFQVPQKGRGSRKTHAAFNDEIVAQIVAIARNAP